MHRPDRHRFVPILAATLIAVLPSLVEAADPVARNPNAINKRLKDVERSIDAGTAKSKSLERASRRLKDSLERSQQERIAAARAIQELENRANELEDEIAQLGRVASEEGKLLEKRRAQFARVLAALQRLSQLPPEAVIARAQPPTDLVRSAILLRSAVPRIEAQAARLRENLIALAETRNALALRRGDLSRARTTLATQEQRLETILKQTRRRHQAAIGAQQTESQRLQALAKEAAGLRELFGGLLRPPAAKRLKKGTIPRPRRKPEGAIQAPSIRQPGLPSIAAARGKLSLPAAGRIARRYGQAAANGITQKGITINTRSGARVVALHAGTVVFAGPFRGYGQLLIISHGEGYHSLLAGLSRIDGILGQTLKAGEPVGVMGRAKQGRPSLYLELRRKGQPVNPMPWLKTSKGKASG